MQFGTFLLFIAVQLFEFVISDTTGFIECFGDWNMGELTVTNVMGVRKKYKHLKVENAVMLDVYYEKWDILERFKFGSDPRDSAYPACSWQLIMPGMAENSTDNKYEVFRDRSVKSEVQNQTIPHSIVGEHTSNRFFMIKNTYVTYWAEISERINSGDGFLLQLTADFDPAIAKMSGGLCV